MKVCVASPVSRPVRMLDFRRPLSVRSLSARHDALVRTTREEVSQQVGQCLYSLMRVLILFVVHLGKRCSKKLNHLNGSPYTEKASGHKDNKKPIPLNP